MNQAEIEAILIKAINDIQTMSGRATVNLNGNSNPYEHCPGFDSLNAVEVTIEVSQQLNIEIPFNNLFVEDNKTLTISEAAVRLMHLHK